MMLKIDPMDKLRIDWISFQFIAILMPISNIFMPSCAVLIAVIALARHAKKILNTPLTRYYLILSMWMFFTTIAAFSPTTAIGGLANFLPYFLLAGITSYIIRTPTQFIHFMWLLVMSSIFVSGFGILQAILNRPDWVLPRLFNSYLIPMGFSGDRRIQSFFGHFNETAIYLLILMPIAIHFAVGKVSTISRYQKNVSLIALLLGICTLVLTSSRNAWGLLVLGLIGICIYYRKWKIVIGFGTIIPIVLWLVFGARFGLGGGELQTLLPKILVNRLSSSFDPQFGDYASTTNRLRAWHFAIDLIRQHPIQGWGLRNFPVVARSMGYDLHGLPHEHNLFLAIAVGSGIPGLLGMVGVVARTIWLSLKSELSRKTEGTTTVVTIGIVLFVLSGFLDIVYYEPRIGMLLWYSIGAMYGLTRASLDLSISGDK
jgi:O-antigen ligase